MLDNPFFCVNIVKNGKKRERLRKGVTDMTIKEMTNLKKEMGLSYQDIADMSGVPLGTVQKVFPGVTTSPR